MGIDIKILKDEASGRYVGSISVDGDLVTKARAPRPGCVARDLLNAFALKYGMPDEVDIEVKEWQ